MVQKQTRLKVADNSGAKELMVIEVIGSTRKRFAYLGEEVTCSVKEAIPGGVVKKKQVVRAVWLERLKSASAKMEVIYVFDDNAAVIIKDGEPVGTRIFGPVAREVRAKGFSKIISLAPEVL